MVGGGSNLSKNPVLSAWGVRTELHEELESKGRNLRQEGATGGGALKSAFKLCPNPRHAWGKTPWNLEKTIVRELRNCAGIQLLSATEDTEFGI